MNGSNNSIHYCCCLMESITVAFGFSKLLLYNSGEEKDDFSPRILRRDFTKVRKEQQSEIDTDELPSNKRSRWANFH